MSILEDKRLLAGLLAAVCIGNFAIFCGPLYIGGLMDAYGLDEVAAGLISTLEIGATALVCLLLPNAVAQTALRQVAMAGAVGVLLLNLVTTWIDTFALMAAVRILAGIAAGMTLAVTSTVIARVPEPDRVIGIALAINTVVMAVVLGIMGYAKQTWLFNGFVYTFSATILVLLPLLWFLPPTVAGKHAPSAGESLGAGGGWLSLGMLGVILLFTFCVIEGSVYAFSERSGLRAGLMESEIGLLLAGAQITGLLGAAIPIVLGERIARLPVILIGVAIITMAGLIIYGLESVELYVFAMLSFSFGFFLAFPYLIGSCARLDSNGVWAARANGGNLLGGALAPVGAGVVVSTSGYGSLATMILILGLTAMAIAIVFSQLYKRRGQAEILVSP